MGLALEDLDWSPCVNWTLPPDQASQSIRLHKLNTLSLNRNTTLFRVLRISDLTDLSLCDTLVNFEDVSKMASSLPNLSILRCIRSIFETSSGETGPPIQFHNLHDLYMVYSESEEEKSAQLAFTLVNRAPTLTRLYHTVFSWDRWPPVSALSCDVGANVTFLEFNLDFKLKWSLVHRFQWGMPGQIDWLVLPNLVTVSLIWASCTAQHRRGNNNRIAAMLLDTISADRANQVLRFCPRLEYLKCCGVTCEEPFIGKSGAEVFFLALENFSWNRSRILNEPESSLETKLCLVTVAWDSTTNSAGLPNLLDGRWEDVTALLDYLSVDADLDMWSDQAETEQSECSWDGTSSEESGAVGEGQEDSDFDEDGLEEDH